MGMIEKTFELKNLNKEDSKEKMVILGREGFFDDSKPLKNEEEFKNLKSNDQFGKDRKIN